jgi:hypothetical protein
MRRLICSIFFLILMLGMTGNLFAATGEFSGIWTITTDVTPDGTVTPVVTGHLNLNSHLNKFVGTYSDIPGNDSIFEGETYPGQVTPVITFRQLGGSWNAVYTGIKVGATLYRGTWYDTLGRSGDFELAQ